MRLWFLWGTFRINRHQIDRDAVRRSKPTHCVFIPLDNPVNWYSNSTAYDEDHPRFIELMALVLRGDASIYPIEEVLR